MSKHIGFYYRCDKCGKESRPFHGYSDDSPCGWLCIKRLHFAKNANFRPRC